MSDFVKKPLFQNRIATEILRGSLRLDADLSRRNNFLFMRNADQIGMLRIKSTAPGELEFERVYSAFPGVFGGRKKEFHKFSSYDNNSIAECQWTELGHWVPIDICVFNYRSQAILPDIDYTKKSGHPVKSEVMILSGVQVKLF